MPGSVICKSSMLMLIYVMIHVSIIYSFHFSDDRYYHCIHVVSLYLRRSTSNHSSPCQLSNRGTWHEARRRHLHLGRWSCISRAMESRKTRWNRNLWLKNHWDCQGKKEWEFKGLKTINESKACFFWFVGEPVHIANKQQLNHFSHH